jgi:hypothetical protein
MSPHIREGITIRDAYGRCYVAPAAYACAVTSHNNRRGVQAVFSVGPLRDYITRPTVSCSASEGRTVEGSVVEFQPEGNGS